MTTTNCKMPGLWLLALAAASVLGSGSASAADASADKATAPPASEDHFKVEDQASEGSVTIDGRKIDYLTHAEIGRASCRERV